MPRQGPARPDLARRGLRAWKGIIFTFGGPDLRRMLGARPKAVGDEPQRSSDNAAGEETGRLRAAALSGCDGVARGLRCLQHRGATRSLPRSEIAAAKCDIYSVSSPKDRWVTPIGSHEVAGRRRSSKMTIRETQRPATNTHRTPEGGLPTHPVCTNAVGRTPQRGLSWRACESDCAVRATHARRAQQGSPAVAGLATLPEREILRPGPYAAGWVRHAVLFQSPNGTLGDVRTIELFSPPTSPPPSTLLREWAVVLASRLEFLTAGPRLPGF